MVLNKADRRDNKKAIKLLKITRKQYKRGDEKWREVNNEIKRLKEEMEVPSAEAAPDQEYAELLKKTRQFYKDTKIITTASFDLSQFSKEDLEFHYLKLTGKVKTKDEYYKMKGIEKPVPAVLVSRRRGSNR